MDIIFGLEDMSQYSDDDPEDSNGIVPLYGGGFLQHDEDEPV